MSLMCLFSGLMSVWKGERASLWMCSMLLKHSANLTQTNSTAFRKFLQHFRKYTMQGNSAFQIVPILCLLIWFCFGSIDAAFLRTQIYTNLSFFNQKRTIPRWRIFFCLLMKKGVNIFSRETFRSWTFEQKEQLSKEREREGAGGWEWVTRKDTYRFLFVAFVHVTMCNCNCHLCVWIFFSYQKGLIINVSPFFSSETFQWKWSTKGLILFSTSIKR